MLAPEFGPLQGDPPTQQSWPPAPPQQRLTFSVGGVSAIRAPQVYGSLNEAGALLSEEAFGDVVKESLKAFELNVGVYSEERLSAACRAGIATY